MHCQRITHLALGFSRVRFDACACICKSFRIFPCSVKLYYTRINIMPMHCGIPVVQDVNRLAFVHISKAGGRTFQHAATEFLRLHLCGADHGPGSRTEQDVQLLQAKRDMLNVRNCSLLSYEMPYKDFHSLFALDQPVGYIMFMRDPTSHFHSQCIFSKQFEGRRLDKTADCFQRFHWTGKVESWSVANPQFKMLAASEHESVLHTMLTMQDRVVGIGITEHYGLSLCVLYFQLYPKAQLPHACRCAEVHHAPSSLGNASNHALYHSVPIIGTQLDTNFSTSQLQAIRELRSADFDIVSHARSLLMQRVHRIQECTKVQLIC